jgi:hypothetical protein
VTICSSYGACVRRLGPVATAFRTMAERYANRKSVASRGQPCFPEGASRRFIGRHSIPRLLSYPINGSRRRFSSVTVLGGAPIAHPLADISRPGDVDLTARLRPFNYSLDGGRGCSDNLLSHCSWLTSRALVLNRCAANPWALHVEASRTNGPCLSHKNLPYCFRFSLLPRLPAALGLGVYSASNRNEYQKQKSNVSVE